MEKYVIVKVDLRSIKFAGEKGSATENGGLEASDLLKMG